MPSLGQTGFATTAVLIAASSAALSGRIVSAQAKGLIAEASGVARLGDYLLIADDAAVGAYYRVNISKNPADNFLFDLNALKPQRVPLKHRGLGVDIESIGVLADGRIALLSERLRSLITDGGIIAEYDSELAEIGKRGLEGLAIRPLPGGASRVAVVWEGGYPDFGQLPRRASARNAWLPLLVMHDIPRNGRVGRVRLKDAIAAIELAVPRPAGVEPEAQRFRVPDFVWTRVSSGKADEGWGFLALLSSQSGTPTPKFQFKWLQRFDIEGRPVGKPLDLALVLPKGLEAVNWEGVNWFEQGRSLVLVHEEDGPSVPPHAFVLELPKDWQFDASPGEAGK